jgi:hypothetical protein
MNQLYFISILAFGRNYNYKNHLFLEVFSNMEVWKCSGCFQTKLKDSFGHMISKQMRFSKKTISNLKNDIGPFLISTEQLICFWGI